MTFFDNGSNFTSNEYLYDANGNMASDANKGITVAYNHFNLPTEVRFKSAVVVFVQNGVGSLPKDLRHALNHQGWHPLFRRNSILIPPLMLPVTMNRELYSQSNTS